MCEEENKSKYQLFSEIIGESDFSDLTFDYYSIFGLEKPKQIIKLSLNVKFIPETHIFPEKASENDIELIQEIMILIVVYFMKYQEG